MPANLPRLLKSLLNLPTAAFVEDAVLDYVEHVCSALQGVSVQRDAYGNLLAHYRLSPPEHRPLVFTAHTDHPGFAALEMLDARTLRAAFRGWVEPEYFVGTRVRFWSNGAWVRGKVLEITRAAKVYRMIGRTARPEEVRVQVAGPVAAGSPGMWDLPDAALRGDTVTARGCDDIAGCAGMLALLERLARRQRAAEVYCLFTRAEEVGFVGAIGAARLGTIPAGLPVIAIETSKTLANAPLGDGPILRVGDKSTIFCPPLTAYCDRVAAELARKRKRFKYQRKLMDGGTCESTAYAVYGYEATGICVALGNYHNMDVSRRRIASESISLSDWQGMVDWFEALVLDASGYDAADGARAVRETIDKRFESYLPLLEASARQAAGAGGPRASR